MKNLLLLIALSFGLISGISYAKDKESNEEELLRKSKLDEPASFRSDLTSYPRSFNRVNAWQNPFNAAVSTGYYWIDDREVINENLYPNMRPTPAKIDTGYQPELWRKIATGPRMFSQSFWTNNKQEGLAFFRQPADGQVDGTFWTLPLDSTDEAIAGPIPIGIQGGFYFNGIRFDSFYVSTNGVIALTNRRYFYDENGNRVIPPGATSAYDPMSMDWLVGGFRGRDTLWVRNWNNTQDSVSPLNQKRIVINDIYGNAMYKNGLNDPVPDNFGYQFSVLGSDPTTIGFDRTVTTNGIRARGGDLITGINEKCRTALIAVFWGDLMLSQYDPVTKNHNEHGVVWYKRAVTKDSLIVAFFNAQPKGQLAAALITPNLASAPVIPSDTRPGDPSYATADAHVVFSSIDSSITIHYTRISDSIVYVDNATGINVKASAREVFRYNTTAGIRGFARHVNFGKGGIAPNQPWAGEYIQATTYWDRYWSDTLDPEVMYPTPMSAVKFKQWKNTLRVQSLNYRVRSRTPVVPNPNDYNTPVPVNEMDDYELLAGHDRLGQIQPFAIVQNLSNEIQGPGGVNFVKQDHTFKVRFLIRNSITGRPVYNRLVPINANCLSLPESQSVNCNGDPTTRVRLVKGTSVSIDESEFKASGFTGIPAYYGAEVRFPAFEPNQFTDEHIGKMRAMAIAENVNPATNISYFDQWPFDDTLKTTMFVMRRYYDQNTDTRFRVFDDDASEWHVDLETGDYIPSVWKWVNINSTVVSGNSVSKYPLAPRRFDTAANYFMGVMSTPKVLHSPTIKMNRLQFNGTEFLSRYGDSRTPQRGGDEIRSFPIDLRGKKGSVLTLSVQRTAHREDWVRGYNDKLLVGPEPRVVKGGNVLDPYIQANAVSNNPDELVVEFAKPSDDEINNITNIPLANWRHHPQKAGSPAGAITNMAALTIYGAGGYLTGFLEKNKDSALSLPGGPTSGQINSLRANLYDDGIDIEYKKFAIPIPDTFVVWKNNGAKHFRFRIKVYATNGRKCGTCIKDDDDDFFVDNIRILYRSEVTDLEISSVKVYWPYTLAPASQATYLPVNVTVSNNTNLNASNFAVKVSIYRVDSLGNHLDNSSIYCRTQMVSNLVPNGTVNLLMPAWNARKSQSDTIGYYRLYANIIGEEPDLIPKNDTTFSDFKLRFSDVFAYDPPTAVTKNSVDDFIIPAGKGLDFLLPQIVVPNPIIGLPDVPKDSPRAGSGIIDNAPAASTANYSPITDAVGDVGGSGSGAVASKFVLLNSDTLRGVRIFWAKINQAADQITIKVYEGGDSLPNRNKVIQTLVSRRGGPNFANIYSKYVTYTFDEPVELARGNYWISVSQDGETGMELGASSSRSGLRTTNVWQDPIAPNWWGEKGISLNLDKNFRTVSDGKLKNDNFFAYQNIIAVGNWIPFTPAVGNPAFGHMDHLGYQGFDASTRTLTRGTWIPLIRPVFGYKSYGEALNQFEICETVPVELFNFTGLPREKGIDLAWETASELNNYGFFVERRISNSDNAEFKQIGFVAGKGNSSSISRYNFLDKDVTAKTTYDYRLRQMDKDGTMECFASNILTLTYEGSIELVLNQNSPNPFVNNTNISFTLPSAQNVKLEVVDLFGNVVNTIADEFLTAKEHSFSFDGRDQAGNPLPTGTYLYRLSGEKEVKSLKMNIVR